VSKIDHQNSVRVKEAIDSIEFLLQQSAGRYPADLPPFHTYRLKAWRAGETTLCRSNFGYKITRYEDGGVPSTAGRLLQRELEIHRSYAEALLVEEELDFVSFDVRTREELIQRALGIPPVSEAERFCEIHSCPIILPRNIADSTEKLLNALQLISSHIDESTAFAYTMFVVAGLRAFSEFAIYGKKLDTLFDKVVSAQSVNQSLDSVLLNGIPAGFEPQFRLLAAIRERLWEIKPSRLAQSGFLLTKVLDAYLSDQPNVGNTLGLTVIDTIIISKFGFPTRYIYSSGTICIEILIENRSIYWDPTRPVPLAFTPMFTGKSLSIIDLIGLSYASLANHYFSKQQWDRAIENYHRVLQLIPDAPETYSDLALSYMHKNQPEKAVAILQEAIRYSPHCASLYHLLGTAYAQSNRWRQAIASYKQAIKVNPDFPEALFNMGLAFEKMGSAEQAVAAFEKAIEIRPDYIAAYLALGNIHLATGRLKEAIRCYREALRLDPNLVAAYYNLGRAYYELKDLDSAIQAYQKAIELNDKHAGAWYNLGIAYRDKGEKDKAVAALEHAVALNPSLLR